MFAEWESERTDKMSWRKPKCILSASRNSPINFSDKVTFSSPRLLISDTFDVLKITLSEAGGVIGNAHTRTELLVPDTGLHVIL